MFKKFTVMQRWGILWLIAMVLMPPAYAVRYNDLLVQISSADGVSTFGYMDHRVTITNEGGIPHTVELILPLDSYGYGNFIRSISRTVTVPAGAAAEISLFQPPLIIRGSQAGVIIDGRLQKENLQIQKFTHCEDYSGRSENYCILLSRQIGFDDINKEMGRVFGQEDSSSKGYMSEAKPYSLAVSQFAVSEWSKNWLSYSRYNGIIMARSEWEVAPPEVRTVLFEYVRGGGNLLVVGAGDPVAEAASFGHETESIFDIYYFGFGRLMTTVQADVSTWKPYSWEVLKNGWNRVQSLQKTRDIKEANDWFPVIDDLSIPVRGLLGIVLVFTILIGPVNIFVLTQKKRQIWLLWTVPMLSVIASVIVFSYAALAEGWKGYTRTQSLTILAENENLATTVGISAFYCPLTPRDGLHFDYETECTPQVDRNHYGGASGRTINWSQDQHFNYGWVKSRVPSHFKLRKSQRRREKLVISSDSENVSILNGFGVQIDALFYADAGGQVYSAHAIAPGAKVSMQKNEKALNGSERCLKDFFENDWHTGMDEIIKEPVLFLQPGHYVAILKQPLFVEQALSRQKSENFESIVYGICQETSNAG